MKNLDKKSIAIFGGTGFFGKSLLIYFIKNKIKINKVVIVSRMPHKVKKIIENYDLPFKIDYFRQDITKSIKYDQHVDYIIHAAAESGTSLSKDNPLQMNNVIVEGTKNILEYACQYKIKRILYISSGAVYGKQPKDINKLPENFHGSPDSLNPLNAYGCAKKQAENLCAIYYHHFGLDYVIARCFAFVGPYLPLDSHFAIGNFIRDKLNNNPITINGGGETIRSYLHSDDLSNWLLSILIKGKTTEAYNVGSDKFITIYNLAQIVCKSLDNDSEIIIKGKPKKYIDKYIPDISKIKNELNVSEKITLTKAIEKTINFHKSESVYGI